MGSKAQSNGRGAIKCEFCKRSVSSLESLQTHQLAVHSSQLKERDKRMITRSRQQPKKAVPPKPTPAATGKKTEPNKVAPPKPQPDLHEEKEELVIPVPPKIVSQKQSLKSLEDRKIEFLCPTCEKWYPTYFSALRHIQKMHCVDENGLKVQPDDPKLIQPIRSEICLRCNEKVKNEFHQCTDLQNLDVGESGYDQSSYICMGCEQKFASMKMFDVHIAGVHNEGVQSLFFPNWDEFDGWKDEMQQQTACSYHVLGKHSQKQIYRCSSTLKDEDTGTLHLCPAQIMTQEFTKGIQAHFFKEHSGHDFDDYVLSKKYSSYSLPDMLSQVRKQSFFKKLENKDQDMYVQFKTLMESIIADAAKINVNTLKVLIEKALEMSSVLTIYDDDDNDIETDNDRTSSPKSRSDEMMTKAIESLKSKTQKHKRENEDSVPVKRSKRLTVAGSEQNSKSPILQKPSTKPAKDSTTFSSSNDKDSAKILKELDDGSISNSKNVVILGQKNNEVSPLLMQKNLPQSPSSFNDSYKEFIDKTISQPKQKQMKTYPSKKKVVVKTKMGQFKPGLSPKSPKSPKSPRKSEGKISIGKVKDIKYEVKERDNDCNILILKI